jgi:hypothetical protein
MIYYPSLTRMIPLTTIRRERLLPVEGEILVNIGARVEPMSTVARAQVPGRYYILNVAQRLRVLPDAVDKYVQVKPGQEVKTGQVVARRRTGLGLSSRVVRAPKDGVVAAVGGGRVLLESVSEPIEVSAYLSGTVSNVMPGKGVLIETVGAWIQGVWGLGGESFGVLKVLSKQPDRPLRARSIDVGCHSAVLVGGSTLDQAALQQALEMQVRGIIIGSLPPSLIGLARDMPFPIIVTDGLGRAPMAKPIFQLLRTNDGREAAISGLTHSRWGAVRPEIVISLPAGRAGSPPAPGATLKVGMQVRLIRGAALGAMGTVRSLPLRPMSLETGARVWGAFVDLEGDEQEQFVPLFNLELLS